MTYTWLADELRKAGLVVVEHTGWKTHHRSGDWSPRYGLVHATAAPRTQSDDVQVRVVRDGRADLPGPIANATVDRQGRWHVLSAGRCNSTLVGTAGPYEGLGNTYALSTEACNDNLSEPWPAVQYESYVRGWAAWCRRLGWSADRLVGHKEHTPGRKTDPTFSMSRFRADVAAVLAGKDDDMTPEEHTWLQTVHRNLTLLDGRNPIGQIYTRSTMGVDHTGAKIPAHPSLKSLGTQLTALQTAVLAAQEGLDTEAIMTRINEVAEAEAARDAQTAAELAGLAELLEQVVELLRKVESGELTAEQVLARLRELLPTAPAA